MASFGTDIETLALHSACEVSMNISLWGVEFVREIVHPATEGWRQEFLYLSSLWKTISKLGTFLIFPFSAVFLCSQNDTEKKKKYAENYIKQEIV